MSSIGKWLVLVFIIICLDVIAISFSGVAGSVVSSEKHYFTVTEVYGNALLGDYVYVRGKISEVLGIHVSRKGYEYQEFVMADDKEEIKLFCSTKYGRTNAEKGDVIVFEGEFKKYYGDYEVYGFCSELIPEYGTIPGQ